jgi:hypothetical protein
MSNWIVWGVDVNAQNVHQVGVEASGPMQAIARVQAMIADMYTHPELYPSGAARMNGDNYERADDTPDWDKLNSIVGWRVKRIS